MSRPCGLLANGLVIEAAQRSSRKLAAHVVPVETMSYAGLRQTYDLCVDGPWHNFVANGIVVHNSFNEFSMRYAKATDDFYVPAVEDVRSQVGKPGAYSFEPVDAELAERTGRSCRPSTTRRSRRTSGSSRRASHESWHVP